mgnify:CR=1 FL=1
MADEKENNTRTRINVSINAKGMAQFDLTCEYDTPERSIAEMSKSIDMVRGLLKEKGIAEAGAIA